SEAAQHEQPGRRGQPRRVVQRAGLLDTVRKAFRLRPAHHDRSDTGTPPGATARRAVLRGAKAHLCRLPTKKSAPSVSTSRDSEPGACAPSTSSGTPVSRRARAIRATGNRRAVEEVVRSTITSLVRAGSTAAPTAAT